MSREHGSSTTRSMVRAAFFLAGSLGALAGCADLRTRSAEEALRDEGTRVYEALTTGDFHSCALADDGTVECWGLNGSGQIGDGTSTDRLAPVTVSGISNAIAVTAGNSHSCALLADGTVKCWGLNGSGQLGDGTTTNRLAPVTVNNIGSSLPRAISLSSGAEHTCAVLADSTARCWGNNANGQLGDGTTTNRSSPTAVGSVTNLVMISGGGTHTCATTAGGEILCWGNNANGQLGDGTTAQRNSPTLVTGSIHDALEVSAGRGHTCAAHAQGVISCWGNNASGEIGDGTNTNRTAPTLVSGITSGVSVSAGGLGGSHSCAMLSSGVAECWGNNANGQLGNGTTTSSNTPVFPAIVGATWIGTTISAGASHTCGIDMFGTVFCWGANANGQIGDGTTSQRTRPVPTSLDVRLGYPEIAGGALHTCALLPDGDVKCWGFNGSGELGNGATTQSTTPVTVALPTLSRAKSICAGAWHTCALTTSNVSCWGFNGEGQLGDGTTTDRSTPVAVSGLGDATAITCGSSHTCAVRSNGTMVCWGRNVEGQLGDGTTTQRNTPTAVSGLSLVGGASAGALHTCAQIGNGTVKCWGDNSFGQLGDGTTLQHKTPTAVSGLSSVTGIAGGYYHTCAAISGGTAKCWGRNHHGQLGDNTTTQRNSPVSVTGFVLPVVRVVAGSHQSCALMSNGSATCWGLNSSGQVGNGFTTDQLSPVNVTFSWNFVSMAAGWNHTCAIEADGTARCWGENGNGQLGNGTTTDASLMVSVSSFP